jgi:hypothetical protein
LDSTVISKRTLMKIWKWLCFFNEF